MSLYTSTLMPGFSAFSSAILSAFHAFRVTYPYLDIPLAAATSPPDKRKIAVAAGLVAARAVAAAASEATTASKVMGQTRSRISPLHRAGCDQARPSSTPSSAPHRGM